MMPTTELSHAAIVVASTGEKVSHQQLLERSRGIARLLHDRGLRVGDHIAIMLPNTHRYFEIAWAAQRSGLYYTPVNFHLTAEEAAYIVGDCGAKALFSTSTLGPLALDVAAATGGVAIRLSTDGPIDGFELLDDALMDTPAEPASREVEGVAMFYSSGTTGRPKGIVRPLPDLPFPSPTSLGGLMHGLYRFDETSVYLSPAPLYHAAPLAWSMQAQRFGGTTIVMESFDAARALDLIRDHRVTNAQFVPTMFVRMLKLPDEVRRAADVSSLRVAVHAAAPCPVDVKRAMIDWWGPIVEEYYAGSEGNGLCALVGGLAHPCRVCRPCDVGHRPHPRRRRPRAGDRRGRNGVLLRRWRIRVPQRSGQDRRVA
jgi:long-chain acyl-CoA synthetase